MNNAHHLPWKFIDSTISSNNKFWTMLGTILDDVFPGTTGDEIASRNDSSRSLYLPRDSIATKHWPSSVFQIKDELQENSILLGSDELDLIAWAMERQRFRLCTVVGRQGTGKTALLRYLFSHVPSRCQSISNAIDAVFLDFNSQRGLVSDENLFKHIYRSLTLAIEQRLGTSDRDQFNSQSSLPSAAVLPSAGSESWRIGCIQLCWKLEEIAQQTGKAFVIVLDNCDELYSETVCTVVSFAKEVLAHCSFIRVVIALRPQSDRTASGVISIRKSYPHLSCQLQVPSLRIVMRHRLGIALDYSEHITSSYSAGVGDGTRQWDAGDVLTALQNALDQPAVYAVIERGFARDDARLMILLLRRVLQNPQLPTRPVDDYLHGKRGADVRHWTKSELITAVLCGRERIFTGVDLRGEDATRSPLMESLLNVDNGKTDNCHALKYRILCCLSAASGVLRTDRVRNYLTRGYYSANVVGIALQSLLSTGLITSPEDSGQINLATHIQLSPRGHFLLQDLLNDDRYLENQIFDAPLAHRLWRNGNHPKQVGIADSMIELVEKLIHQEEVFIASLNHQGIPDAANVINSGVANTTLAGNPQVHLLSEIIYSHTFLRIIRQGALPHELKSRMEQLKGQSLTQITKIREKAVDLVEQVAPSAEVKSLCDVTWPDGHYVRLRGPDHLKPDEVSILAITWKLPSHASKSAQDLGVSEEQIIGALQMQNAKFDNGPFQSITMNCDGHEYEINALVYGTKEEPDHGKASSAGGVVGGSLGLIGKNRLFAMMQF